jgi:histidinol-phosphate aminotransferase
MRPPMLPWPGASSAATVALTDDIGWMRTTVKQGVENRERLTLELARRGFGPLASHANFVCIPSTESASIARVLLEHGIAVRGLAGLRDIGDVFRVATAPWNELQLFLAALDDWISRK